jgi:hypothetical protein
MIVSDIITRVRRVFGDEAAVQVTDDDIIRWINDAQIEIVKHNDAALQKTDFIDLVASQSTYVLPADLLILRSLRFKFSDMLSFSALHYKNMQEFDDQVDGWDGTGYNSGTPIYFTMFEGKAILFPTPDQSLVDGLKVLYNFKPVEVDDSLDTLSLPLLYHNTIFKYCMWQASLLDEDHEPAMMYKGDFQQDMGMLMNSETKDPVATYPTITTVGYDAD